MRTAFPGVVSTAVLLGVVTAITTHAQAPAIVEPTFEVASVKPRDINDSTGFSARFEPGGRFVAVNAPLTLLIPTAYGRAAGRVIGAPPWLGRQGFDINARADGDPPRDMMMQMLRSLLKDRFKLGMHYETREEDTYALVLARGDGALGSGLRKTDVDCAARAAAAKAGNPMPALPPAANGRPVCQTLSISGTLTSGGMTPAALATALRFGAGRAVVDKTGLTGYYEVTLKYADKPPEAVQIDDPPTFVTAVREQLGLRFEPQRSPVEVLVIDRVEQPTPD